MRIPATFLVFSFNRLNVFLSLSTHKTGLFPLFFTHEDTRLEAQQGTHTRITTHTRRLFFFYNTRLTQTLENNTDQHRIDGRTDPTPTQRHKEEFWYVHRQTQNTDKYTDTNYNEEKFTIGTQGLIHNKDDYWYGENWWIFEGFFVTLMLKHREIDW